MEQKVQRIREIIRKAETELSQVCDCKVSVSISLKNRVIKNSEELDKLKHLIWKTFGITWEEIKGLSRLREIVSARYCFMYIAHTQYSLNKSQIGDMCNRDHTSVIHAINTVNNLYSINDPVIRLIDEIKVLTA